MADLYPFIIDKDFGPVLKAALKLKKMTQKELSKRMDITPGLISHWINSVEPKQSSIDRILNSLGDIYISYDGLVKKWYGYQLPDPEKFEEYFFSRNYPNEPAITSRVVSESIHYTDTPRHLGFKKLIPETDASVRGNVLDNLVKTYILMQHYLEMQEYELKKKGEEYDDFEYFSFNRTLERIINALNDAISAENMIHQNPLHELLISKIEGNLK